MQPSPSDVPALVDRWVAAGIITAEQAQRIRDDLASLQPRRSLVAEGLGYLGGVVVLVGLGLLLSLSWDHLGPAGRVAVAAGITTALLVAGALVPARRLGAPGRRLRGVLWALGTVGVVASIGVFAVEQLGWQEESQVLLVSGAGAGAFSAVLWAIHRHVLQHLSTVWPVVVAANTGVDLATDSWFLSSLAVWSVGVVWFVLSLPDLIPQRGGGVVGALAAIGGGLLMIGEEQGPLLALGTVVALVLTGMARRDLALLGISSAATLIVLPFAVDRYLPGGALTTALAIVATGLALLGAAIYTARRRRADPPVPVAAAAP